MPSFVALLRGINVGKAKRIPMAELREVFEQLGMTTVKTLLQSGNVVFRASQRPDHLEVEEAVFKRTGVRSSILVLSEDEFRAVASADPMIEVSDDLSKQMIVFLDRDIPAVELPDPELLAPELITQGERAFYQWFALGVLETKVPNSFWKQVGSTGVVATARNRRTVEKLLAMLDGMPVQLN